MTQANIEPHVNAEDYHRPPTTMEMHAAALGYLSLDHFNENYLGKPRETSELHREYHGRRPLPGYTPLIPGRSERSRGAYQHPTDLIRHLPYAAGGRGPSGYGGNLYYITTGVHTGAGSSEHLGEENYTWTDMAYGPGKLYAEARAREAEITREFSELQGMNAAYALYELDADAEHPLSEPNTPYAKAGDFRLIDVMTDNDPNPSNGYIHTAEWLQTHPDRPPELRLITGSLSDEAEGFGDFLQEQYKDYARVISASINVMGLAYARVAAGKVTWDQAMVELSSFAKRGVPSGMKADVVDYVQMYLASCPSPFDWRVPCRAYQRLQALDKAEASLGRFNLKARKQIDRQRAYVLSEVIQAYGMVKREHDLTNAAAAMVNPVDGGSMMHFPVRWKLSVLDRFDIDFANSLAGLRKGPYAEAAQGVSRAYSNIKGQKTFVLAQATAGNELTVRHVNGPAIADGVLLSDGTSQPYQAPQGALPEDMVMSFYDKSQPLKMTGVVCTLEAGGRHMGERVRRYLLVNLMEAPGKLLQQLHQDGYLRGDKPKHRPTLYEQLRRPSTEPMAALVKWPETGKPVVVATAMEGEAVHLIRSADHSRILVDATAIADRHTAERHAGSQPTLRDRRALKQRRAVLEPLLNSGDTKLVSLAMEDGVPHISDALGPGVRALAMRSHAPLRNNGKRKSKP